MLILYQINNTKLHTPAVITASKSGLEFLIQSPVWRSALYGGIKRLKRTRSCKVIVYVVVCHLPGRVCTNCWSDRVQVIRNIWGVWIRIERRNIVHLWNPVEFHKFVEIELDIHPSCQPMALGWSCCSSSGLWSRHCSTLHCSMQWSNEVKHKRVTGTDWQRKVHLRFTTLWRCPRLIRFLDHWRGN